MAERRKDRITSTADKPIPMGMTVPEAEAMAEQAHAKAVEVKPVEPVVVAPEPKAPEPVVAEPESKVAGPAPFVISPVKVYADPSKSMLVIREYLSAITLIARDLPNSEKLAIFTVSIMAALRQLDDMEK
jgi:hypothetical protein